MTLSTQILSMVLMSSVSMSALIVGSLGSRIHMPAGLNSKNGAPPRSSEAGMSLKTSFSYPPRSPLWERQDVTPLPPVYVTLISTAHSQSLVTSVHALLPVLPRAPGMLYPDLPSWLGSGTSVR